MSDLRAILERRLAEIPTGQKQPFTIKTLLQLGVEAEICKMLAADGWSSRVRADEIVEVVLRGLVGEIDLEPEPWKAFGFENPPQAE